MTLLLVGIVLLVVQSLLLFRPVKSVGDFALIMFSSILGVAYCLICSNIQE